jgi:hypothetical protein
MSYENCQGSKVVSIDRIPLRLFLNLYSDAFFFICLKRLMDIQIIRIFFILCNVCMYICAVQAPVMPAHALHGHSAHTHVLHVDILQPHVMHGCGCPRPCSISLCSNNNTACYTENC